MNYLLVHGLGLSAEIWSRLRPHLNGQVLAVNLPGHGDSDSDLYLWQDMLESILIDSAVSQWAETIVVLHSFSACLLPEFVRLGVKPHKVVLIEGILHSSDAHWSNAIASMSERNYLAWLSRFRTVSEIALRHQLVSPVTKPELEMWSKAFRVVRANALWAMAKNLQARLNTDDLLLQIANVEFPVIYLRGEHSRLSSQGRDCIAGIPIPIKEISASGHFPMIDNPLGLAELLN